MSAVENEDGAVTLSREELYRQIWQEPRRTVAPRYGLSDAGLAKVCRKHRIPRPPVGYWAKNGAGHHVEQTPLPTLDDESLQEIHIFRRQFFAESPATASTGEKIVVEVPERLSNAHPLIIKTKQELGSRKSQDSNDASNPPPVLDIDVSSQVLPRALRVFNAVIRKWEELGGDVAIDAARSPGERTRFAYGEDSLGVSLTEEVERIERKSGRNRYYRDWDYKPTGRLVFQVFTRWGADLRRRWADGKKQRLENVLGSFISGLQKWIAHQKEERLEDETEKRQRAKAREIRARREELARQFEQQADNLEQCAEAFAQSERIRLYLSIFESKITAAIVRPTNPKTFPKWMEWAKWYADYLDPLTPTPNRDDFTVVAKNVSVADLEWTKRTHEIVQALDVTDTDELYRIEREKVMSVGNGYNSNDWCEISLVLEGLGYDVSNRQRY